MARQKKNAEVQTAQAAPGPLVDSEASDEPPATSVLSDAEPPPPDDVPEPEDEAKEETKEEKATLRHLDENTPLDVVDGTWFAKRMRGTKYPLTIRTLRMRGHNPDRMLNLGLVRLKT